MFITMISIAIDGPAGAGKSSISKAAAKTLGYVYIDTGAMYRACALYAIENDIEITADALSGRLDEIKIDLSYTDEGQRIYLCGRDVSERIRKADVSVAASDIAVIGIVRKKLVAMQRELAKGHNVIMDGRDIGTHVLPDAQVKIFLTASVDERARRRSLELAQKGMHADFEQVKEDIIYRDKNDSEREESPLRQAEDAVLLDTTGLDFNESVAAVLKLINERI